MQILRACGRRHAHDGISHMLLISSGSAGNAVGAMLGGNRYAPGSVTPRPTIQRHRVRIASLPAMSNCAVTSMNFVYNAAGQQPSACAVDLRQRTVFAINSCDERKRNNGFWRATRCRDLVQMRQATATNGKLAARGPTSVVPIEDIGTLLELQSGCVDAAESCHTEDGTCGQQPAVS